MLSEKLTLVIHSCDKFSDLWDTHMMLLNKNWADRGIDTILMTDKQTDKCYLGVRVISAGDGAELSQRSAIMLKHIETEYVLITLDDYFPIHQISTEKIDNLILAMEREQLDYIRLFKRPNSHKRFTGYDDLYEINLKSKKDYNYQVNLYVGIWRKSFIEKTVRLPLNAWQYEVSLTKIAREVNAKCALSKGKEFEILDVVRKGQILHKANRYLKKHDLYHGPRKVISWATEYRINIFTLIKEILPQYVIDFGKHQLNKIGHHFYSDESV